MAVCTRVIRVLGVGSSVVLKKLCCIDLHCGFWNGVLGVSLGALINYLIPFWGFLVVFIVWYSALTIKAPTLPLLLCGLRLRV